jgi:hypothetical protein
VTQLDLTFISRVAHIVEKAISARTELSAQLIA